MRAELEGKRRGESQRAAEELRRLTDRLAAAQIEADRQRRQLLNDKVQMGCPLFDLILFLRAVDFVAQADMTAQLAAYKQEVSELRSRQQLAVSAA